ncbi:MAG: hypothetical protein HQL31_05270, partial [Planctomycetes bacterium]|nr:hypothetical protein [Planctomycetota bacterium]
MKINHDIVRKIPFAKNIQRIKSQKSVPGFIINRIHWHLYPRLRLLREYPVHVDIELSSLCQLDCPMGFRRHRAIP